MNFRAAARDERRPERLPHRRHDPQRRLLRRVAQANRRVIQECFQRRLEYLLVQLEGQYVGHRRDHRHRCIVDFNPQSRARFRDDGARDRDDALRLQSHERRRRVVEDCLHDATAVAHEDEGHAAERPDLMQPPRDAHHLPDVPDQFTRQYPFLLPDFDTDANHPFTSTRT